MYSTVFRVFNAVFTTVFSGFQRFSAFAIRRHNVILQSPTSQQAPDLHRPALCLQLKVRLLLTPLPQIQSWSSRIRSSSLESRAGFVLPHWNPNIERWGTGVGRTLVVWGVDRVFLFRHAVLFNMHTCTHANGEVTLQRYERGRAPTPHKGGYEPPLWGRQTATPPRRRVNNPLTGGGQT